MASSENQVPSGGLQDMSKLRAATQSQGSPRVLVMGATGKTGKPLVELLSRDQNIQLVAGVHHQEDVDVMRRAVPGAEVRLVELKDYSTYAPFLRGIDVLFLVLPYSVDMLQEVGRKLLPAPTPILRLPPALGSPRLFSGQCGRVSLAQGSGCPRCSTRPHSTATAWLMTPRLDPTPYRVTI
jgi:hypothetical protein